jgi:hypothetical protein
VRILQFLEQFRACGTKTQDQNVGTKIPWTKNKYVAEFTSCDHNTHAVRMCYWLKHCCAPTCLPSTLSLRKIAQQRNNALFIARVAKRLVRSLRSRHVRITLMRLLCFWTKEVCNVAWRLLVHTSTRGLNKAVSQPVTKQSQCAHSVAAPCLLLTHAKGYSRNRSTRRTMLIHSIVVYLRVLAE